MHPLLWTAPLTSPRAPSPPPLPARARGGWRGVRCLGPTATWAYRRSARWLPAVPPARCCASTWLSCPGRLRLGRARGATRSSPALASREVRDGRVAGGRLRRPGVDPEHGVGVAHGLGGAVAERSERGAIRAWRTSSNRAGRAGFARRAATVARASISATGAPSRLRWPPNDKTPVPLLSVT